MYSFAYKRFFIYLLIVLNRRNNALVEILKRYIDDTAIYTGSDIKIQFASDAILKYAGKTALSMANPWKKHCLNLRASLLSLF